MKNLFFYLLIFFLLSMILCTGEEQDAEAEAEAEETEAEEGEETQAAANAYGGACTTDPDSCTDTTTQQCTNGKCACKSGYKEKSDKSGCEQDTTTTTTPQSNSSIIKNSLLILLGITIF